MEKVRIDVSLCETLSVSHKAVGSHTRRPLLEVSLGGGGGGGGGGVWVVGVGVLGVGGGGGGVVDLVEIGGFLLVYWGRGEW